jgi:prolyl oligopeptidase
VLILTADNDDRVFPAHSFKYAAALQAAQRGDAPILLRVDVRAGHGPGLPASKKIDAEADVLTFLVEALR